MHLAMSAPSPFFFQKSGKDQQTRTQHVYTQSSFPTPQQEQAQVDQPCEPPARGHHIHTQSHHTWHPSIQLYAAAKLYKFTRLSKRLFVEQKREEDTCRVKGQVHMPAWSGHMVHCPPANQPPRMPANRRDRAGVVYVFKPCTPPASPFQPATRARASSSPPPRLARGARVRALVYWLVGWLTRSATYVVRVARQRPRAGWILCRSYRHDISPVSTR